ncbi:ATP-binding protein [Eubacteriaceae bacterium ES3]|nr:ATP-binding protein [Eubacteriaceae bacterium ES3]
MKKRLILALTIVSVISILTCGIFAAISYRDNYYENTKQRLVQDIDYVSGSLLSDFLETGKTEELEAFSNSTYIRMTIVERDGTVLYDSLKDASEMENHQYRPEIIGAFSGEISSEARYSNTLLDDMLYVAAPYYNDVGEISGVIRLAMPLNALDTAVFEMINNIIFVLLATIIATLILVTFFVNRELRPLDEVSVFAEEIAAGQFGNEMTMIREDEIGELVESLNQMSRQLKGFFEEMDHKNSELTSILSSMNHGVIAIDDENYIVHLNDSGKKLLNIRDQGDLTGKNILEVYRESFMYELMVKLDETGTDKVRFESRLNDNQVIRVSVNPMIENKSEITGHIIVLEDITLIKNLEKMRRDFVANVSHELKTPITTIKGFIETIKENDIKDQETLDRFYNIIFEESNRLSRLVSDILVLSQLENNSGFEKEEQLLNIHDEVHQVFDLLAIGAREKQIQLELSGNANTKIRFKPDEFRQMMINLVDNGIKYSEANGKLEVSVDESESQIEILVKDQGFGIPEKDIDRIFERFYRVDKSRSKEKGGTGLGLAIVKHIIINNKGTVRVESRAGKGTTFFISFPL